jgi:hypothetical protein
MMDAIDVLISTNTKFNNAQSTIKAPFPVDPWNAFLQIARDNVPAKFAAFLVDAKPHFDKWPPAFLTEYDGFEIQHDGIVPVKVKFEDSGVYYLIYGWSTRSLEEAIISAHNFWLAKEQ